MKLSFHGAARRFCTLLPFALTAIATPVLAGDRNFNISADAAFSRMRLPEFIAGSRYAVTPTTEFPTLERFHVAETGVEGTGLRFRLGSGPLDVLGIETEFRTSGFYVHYSGAEKSVECAPDSNWASFCSMNSPIDEPGFVDFSSVFPDAFVFLSSTRKPVFWGFGAEAVFTGIEFFGFEPKSGIAFRQLRDDLAISAISWIPGGWVSHTEYRHQMDTDYAGVYLGLTREQPAGDFLVTLDAEAGLFLAVTDYAGSYQSDPPLSERVPVQQFLSLGKEETAIMARLRTGLERRFSRFSVSGFVQGQFISYVPQILYNDVERFSGIQIGNTQDGTNITSDIAYEISAGVKITFPF